MKPAKKEKRTMLTTDQRKAMRAVKDGADVYAYGIAMRLREVERAFPAYIEIGPAMGAPSNGAAAQPYFGAMLTAAGKRALAVPRAETGATRTTGEEPAATPAKETDRGQ